MHTVLILLCFSLLKIPALTYLGNVRWNGGAYSGTRGGFTILVQIFGNARTLLALRFLNLNKLRETMGEIMTTISAKELAKKEGIGLDALRARWNKLFAENNELFREAWDKNRPILYAQETALRSAKSAKKKTGTVRRTSADKPMAAQGQTARPDEVAPPVGQEDKKQEEPAEISSADWLLDFINYFENGMAFTGFLLLFDWVGIAPGLICCAFYLHSMAVMKRPKAWESASLSKFVCFILAAVFGWVHFQTFTWALNEYRPDIDAPFFVSLCGAVLLSGISLMALYQSRNVKTDNQ